MRSPGILHAKHTEGSYQQSETTNQFTYKRVVLDILAERGHEVEAAEAVGARVEAAVGLVDAGISGCACASNICATVGCWKAGGPMPGSAMAALSCCRWPRIDEIGGIFCEGSCSASSAGCGWKGAAKLTGS